VVVSPPPPPPPSTFPQALRAENDGLKAKLEKAERDQHDFVEYFQVRGDEEEEGERAPPSINHYTTTTIQVHCHK